MLIYYFTQKSAARNFGKGSLPVMALSANINKNSRDGDGCCIIMLTYVGIRRQRKSIPCCAISGSLLGSVTLSAI